VEILGGISQHQFHSESVVADGVLAGDVDQSLLSPEFPQGVERLGRGRSGVKPELKSINSEQPKIPIGILGCSA
jgi:hypothetical protein